MENPGALYHPAGGLKHRSASYYVGVVFVGALHIAAIYAFMNAIGVPLVTKPPKEIVMKLFPDKPDDQPIPKQQPPKVVLEQAPQKPSVVEPVIDIQTPPTQTTIQLPPADSTPQVAIADTAASTLGTTHTIPPYPANARRLGQEGSVKLKITISAQGRITHIDIMQSSGVAELDRAAADWVFAHWRYNPAIRGGVAVESTTMASVTFNLKNAR